MDSASQPQARPLHLFTIQHRSRERGQPERLAPGRDQIGKVGDVVSESPRDFIGISTGFQILLDQHLRDAVRDDQNVRGRMPPLPWESTCALPLARSSFPTQSDSGACRGCFQDPAQILQALTIDARRLSIQCHQLVGLPDHTLDDGQRFVRRDNAPPDKALASDVGQGNASPSLHGYCSHFNATTSCTAPVSEYWYSPSW
ncbi:hypothetical protein ACVIU4_008596 [Bradyrhizobium barranii subsp. barranii]|nr:hypothetical protein [Bradyrhizobium japonicum]MCP1960785.1 hypothetical protein [Bradyrhizobium japonicum]